MSLLCVLILAWEGLSSADPQRSVWLAPRLTPGPCPSCLNRIFCGPASKAHLQTSWHPSSSCLAFGIASHRRPCPELPPRISRRAQPGGRRPEKRVLAGARAWRARTASPWTAATVALGRRKVSRGRRPGSTRGAGEVRERRSGRSQRRLGFLSHRNPDCGRGGGMEKGGLEYRIRVWGRH